MSFKNFWYSYKNILLRQILKKKYNIFFRRIFGILYKFILRYLKHTFLFNMVNLDHPRNKHFHNFQLDDLFIEFNCDKGPHCIWDKKKVYTHKYSIFYEKYFSKLKNKEIKILELGSHEGRGIASFYYYFPQAHLYGANINPFQMIYKSKRIIELFVDVSSKEILNNLAHHLDFDLDIIIDDASHNLRDILLALPIFFKKLKKEGYYVIEDADQFKVYKELNPTNEQLTPLKILDCIKKDKKFQSIYLQTSDVDYLKKNIKNYYFEKGRFVVNGYNVSDIVFLQKK